MAQTAESRPLPGWPNSMEVESGGKEETTGVRSRTPSNTASADSPTAPDGQGQMEATVKRIRAMIKQFKGTLEQITEHLTRIQQLAALPGGESKAFAHLTALAHQYRPIVAPRSTSMMLPTFKFDKSGMSEFDSLVTGKFKAIDDTPASSILQPKLRTMSTAKLLDEWEPMKLRWKLRDVDASYRREEGYKVNAFFPRSNRILAEAAGRRAARTKVMRAAGRVLPVELVDAVAEFVFAMEWEERQKNVEKSVGLVGGDATVCAPNWTYSGSAAAIAARSIWRTYGCEIFGGKDSEAGDEVEGDVENLDEDEYDDEYDYEGEEDDEDDFDEDYEGLGQLNSYHSSLGWM